MKDVKVFFRKKANGKVAKNCEKRCDKGRKMYECQQKVERERDGRE